MFHVLIQALYIMMDVSQVSATKNLGHPSLIPMYQFISVVTQTIVADMDVLLLLSSVLPKGNLEDGCRGLRISPS
jgi:hypothetical protein